jgi:tripartite-type tricarboxylate transporter receptor subunit TctC
MRRRFLVTAAPLLPLLAHAPARGQAYPSRAIHYIVPVAAGGGSDLVGRTLTERWGRALGQNFVVENIGGGGGAIACQTTAKAAPDG